MISKLFRLLAVALLVMCVVVPNSMKPLAAGLLCVCALISLSQLRMRSSYRMLGMFLASSGVVTLLYMLVGALRGAPFDAMVQVAVIYIVSPALWMFVLLCFLDLVSKQALFSILTVSALAACLSVGLFVYLFKSFGPASVRFFIENPNLQWGDGVYAATLHVYGSLIFLSGAYFAAPRVVSSLALRCIVLGSLMAAALTSGRTALIFAIFVGGALGLLSVSRQQNMGGRRRVFSLFIFIVAIASVGLVLHSLQRDAAFDVSLLLRESFEKLHVAGGDVRFEQVRALLEGAQSSWFLGSGHGVGVSLTSSERFPWRYELVWAATLFRVGVLGSLVYVAPFIFYLFVAFRGLLLKRLDDYEMFMFGGFVAVFLASNTNPYIEAFAFQWMFVLPVVSWFVWRRARKSNSVAIERT